eukprot:8845122-Pyramimonas_sp.AAC.2
MFLEELTGRTPESRVVSAESCEGRQEELSYCSTYGARKKWFQQILAAGLLLLRSKTASHPHQESLPAAPTLTATFPCVSVAGTPPIVGSVCCKQALPDSFAAPLRAH